MSRFVTYLSPVKVALEQVHLYDEHLYDENNFYFILHWEGNIPRIEVVSDSVIIIIYFTLQLRSSARSPLMR